MLRIAALRSFSIAAVVMGEFVPSIPAASRISQRRILRAPLPGGLLLDEGVLTPPPPHPHIAKISDIGAPDMAYVEISDDTIWAKQIEGGKALKDKILALAPGEVIELEVDGIVGAWEKMRNGRDGRATMGLKPIGPMKEIWKRLQARRGEVVEVRQVRTADAYLAALSETMTEWNSPEDEEGFRDL